jgi:GrpB-like predicted nucleotidyltransferase (UPF0157 family)
MNCVRKTYVEFFFFSGRIRSSATYEVEDRDVDKVIIPVGTGSGQALSFRFYDVVLTQINLDGGLVVLKSKKLDVSPWYSTGFIDECRRGKITGYWHTIERYVTVNKEYTLEAYSSEWIDRFMTIQTILEDIFKENMLQIEHVGSTSIVGMTAKPIIDVLVVIQSFNRLDKFVLKMISCGYVPKKDHITENSFFFSKDVNGIRMENIHVFPEGHPHIADLLDKRDYLRTHPEEVKHYMSLKIELAQKYPDDYIAYRRHKDQYLDYTLEKKVWEWKKGEK